MARVKGRNGKTRELSAVFDANWPYCCLMKMDASQLGYIEVLNRPQEWASLRPDQVPTILDLRGMELCTIVSLGEVSVGSKVVKDVGAVVLELNAPQMIPVDLILGRTFLGRFKVTFDPGSRSVSLV